MSDELLPFYERELKYLQALGKEFAGRHPQVAGRLKLGSDGTSDPHVERLVQAVAFLNARIRHKLEDDFPELTESLLGVLYPHYLRPVPSMAIAQMELDTSQAEMFQGYTVPRGTAVETEPDAVVGEPCLYRTAYDTALWPMRVGGARLVRRPFTVPATPLASRAAAALHVQLQTFSSQAKFTQLRLPKLRLFLHRGNNTNVYRLLELLFTDVVEICLAPSPSAERFVTLPPSRLSLVGFERHESLLPDDARTFPGYRMLSEYFAFPHKHLFVDLDLGDPTASDWALAPLTGEGGSKLELFFLLRRGDADLERDVSAETIRLGCTPIVNLFIPETTAFLLDQRASEHQITPRSSQPLGSEVYSIDEVEAVSPDQEVVTYQPFFSWKHGRTDGDRQAYWHASVRPGAGSDPTDPQRIRQEAWLSLVDLGFRPSQPEGWTLRVKTTCFNGDAPGHLPGGAAGGVPRPLLQFPEGAGPVKKLVCVSPPTQTLRPERGPRALWRLISHLSLNHLSLVEGQDAAASLREILQLYNLRQSAETQALIDSIIDVRAGQVVRRIGWRAGGFGLGMQVRVTIDEGRLSGLGGYLLAAVLDRFLGMYVAVNSFTELVVQSKQRVGQEEPWKWPKRTGEKVLV